MFSVVSYKSSAWICDIAGLARRFNVIEQASILVFLCDHTHMACVPLGAVVEGCVSFMSEVQTLPQGFARPSPSSNLADVASVFDARLRSAPREALIE